VGSVGNVWMLEYETYIKEKRLERYSLRQDEIYLREAYRRAKAEQRWQHSSIKGIRLRREALMNHLYDLQMSWFKHAKKAWKLSLILFGLSVAALLHGLFPFIFIKTTSTGVHKLHNFIQSN
tara:strand:+ start:1473 stop:1838 length:366 start_codon:yes stop_codon:yes gene_type:complete